MSRSKKRSSCRRKAFFLPDLAFRARKQAADVVGVEENDQSGADHQVYHLRKIDPGEKRGVHAPDEEEEHATHHRRQAADRRPPTSPMQKRDEESEQNGHDALREVQYKYDKCWKFTECP